MVSTTTLVALGDDAVGLKIAISRDRRPRPHVRLAALHRAVGEHVGATVGPEPRDDEAAGVRRRGRRHRRIDSHHDAMHGRRGAHPMLVDPVAPPQRAAHLVDQLAVQLPPAE
jgi:hypothetical protein